MNKKTVLAVFLMATAAHAAEEAPPAQTPQPEPEKNVYIEGFVGEAFLTSSSSGGNTNFLTYGGRFGAGVYSDRSGILSLGLAIDTLSNSATVSGVTATAGVTAILPEIIARRMFGTGLYLGGRFGVGITSVSATKSTTSISASGTSFASGPALGYEIDIIPHLSLGIDLSWITRAGTTLTFPTGVGTLQVDSVSYLMLQGGLVAHF